MNVEAWTAAVAAAEDDRVGPSEGSSLKADPVVGAEGWDPLETQEEEVVPFVGD